MVRQMSRLAQSLASNGSQRMEPDLDEELIWQPMTAFDTDKPNDEADEEADDDDFDDDDDDFDDDDDDFDDDDDDSFDDDDDGDNEVPVSVDVASFCDWPLRSSK